MTFYTEEEYAKAYTELLEVLKHVPKASVDKIPKENMDYYLLKSDKNYKYHYNNGVKFEDQNLSHLTRIMIANIYTEYWMNDQQKEKLEQNNKIEIEKIEDEKREKYNPDDLFKNRKQTAENNTEIEGIKENSDVNTESINEQMDMIIPEKDNVFKRLINKIKRIFHLT